MSAAARLLAQWPEIRAELARIPRAWVPELIEYLELALEASRWRGEAGGQASAERSAVTRGRIRAVVGALPLSRPMKELEAMIVLRLGARGWKAGRWTVDDELRLLRKEALESVQRPTRIRGRVRASRSTGKGNHGQGGASEGERQRRGGADREDGEEDAVGAEG